MKDSDLVVAVSNVTGASFIGLDTQTIPTLRGGKKNPMAGRITKKTVGTNVMVFTNTNHNAYAAMVHRRLLAEGKDPASFELSPRVWGTRVPNMPIVEHNGSYYLEVIVLKTGTVTYMLDGAPIDAADIEGLPPVELSEQGGLDNKIMMKAYAAGSITELRVDGLAFH